MSPDTAGAARPDSLDKIIKRDEIDRYYKNGRDFIDDDAIRAELAAEVSPDPARVRDILQKSLAIETLTGPEVATLLAVEDKDLLAEMADVAWKVKHKVYDNRVVTFAPMYVSSYCINRCRYCGFSADNHRERRRCLSHEEILREAEAMIRLGHKRVMAVYGEHPMTGAEFIAQSLATIYSARVPGRRPGAVNCVRRINVNAAPMSIDDLKVVHDAGIGTFQVFQETYDHKAYAAMHPADTVKGDMGWRLTCMHRAFDAGIDDVGLGVLFGLQPDWKFDVAAMCAHARELERYSGIGPHTFSVPRMHAASGSDVANAKSSFTDDDFFRAVLVLRLAVPYTGLIVTARETKALRDRCVKIGLTQMDAGTRIDIGGYAAGNKDQKIDEQQFLLGDNRSLEQMIVDLAKEGIITSFCTAGYRCGRTGGCIMDALKTGREGTFCKINAVLTYREWLDDFASPESVRACEPVIDAELAAIKEMYPKFYPVVMDRYNRICNGERDLYF
ncbi:MAG: [Kiritimatiellae bacterium]|nr:[FeFe] hydrogenase H-cluster radical SAM maturase HydG [Kiritimatiellia bacterium]